MFCKQILGENRMRKAENPERDVFWVCSADSERGCPHILPRDWSASERCLFLLCLRDRTWHRLQRRKKGHDSVIWQLRNSIEQKWKNNFKIEYMCLDWGGLWWGILTCGNELVMASAIHVRETPLPKVKQPLYIWNMLNQRCLFYQICITYIFIFY